jgi:hypothetical protein
VNTPLSPQARKQKCKLPTTTPMRTEAPVKPPVLLQVM